MLGRWLDHMSKIHGRSFNTQRNQRIQDAYNNLSAPQHTTQQLVRKHSLYASTDKNVQARAVCNYIVEGCPIAHSYELLHMNLNQHINPRLDARKIRFISNFYFPEIATVFFSSESTPTASSSPVVGTRSTPEPSHERPTQRDGPNSSVGVG